MREISLERKTKETKIELYLNLDGKGEYKIDTGVGFFNHMLELFSGHSGFDLNVKCVGDIDVDFHHTVEDVGIVLGKAISTCLADRKGISRFSNRIIPMDDSVASVALDVSNRPYLNFIKPLSGKVGDFDLELVEEFFRAVCVNAGLNMYVDILCGSNNHHKSEAIFKGAAKCFSDAFKVVGDRVPSTKGVL